MLHGMLVIIFKEPDNFGKAVKRELEPSTSGETPSKRKKTDDNFELLDDPLFGLVIFFILFWKKIIFINYFAMLQSLNLVV